MISWLIFFLVETCLNITFATSTISLFAKNLSYQYIKAIKMVFHYLKGLWQRGIICGGRDNKDDKGLSIVDYLDSN